MTIYFKKYSEAKAWGKKHRRDGVIRYDSSTKMYGIFTF